MHKPLARRSMHKPLGRRSVLQSDSIHYTLTTHPPKWLHKFQARSKQEANRDPGVDEDNLQRKHSNVGHTLFLTISIRLPDLVKKALRNKNPPQPFVIFDIINACERSW